MSQPPLRFVHASDLHLEQPLGGLAEVPEQLRELLLEAPYQAARRVFETALTEEADALLLAGDVVDLERSGPRAIMFLLEQFARLAQHGIDVYWAGGRTDPVEAWPPAAELPENVHLFASGEVESIALERDGEPVAAIQGISRSQGAALEMSGFYRDADGLFTVGVAYGTAALPGAEGDRVHYMALGGQHHRQTVDQSPGVAHYCGTPQGRSPRETGPHGCTVVTVDGQGQVKTQLVPCDPIRWLTETIEITASTDHRALQRQMEDRLQKLRARHPELALLVSWQVQGHGTLLYHLRTGGVSDQITAELRRSFGRQMPGAWTVGIQCDAPLEVPPEWYHQETIRGDLLRQFQQLEADQESALRLEDFLPDDLRSGPLAPIAEVSADQRGGLLLAASKMGIDLMDGDDL